MEKMYHISDTLQQLIDWESIYKMPRCAMGHDEQMKGLFKDAKVIAHWNEGSYQGMVATCVKLPDGRYLIYNDYYGSCSGCDSWEGATDEEVKKMCIDLANGAYIFRSFEDVITFLSQEEGLSYEWNNCAKPLLKMVNAYCFMSALFRYGFVQDDKSDDNTTILTKPWFGFNVDVRLSKTPNEANSTVVFDFNANRPSDGKKQGIRTMIEIPDCLHGTRDVALVDYLEGMVFRPTFEKLNTLFVTSLVACRHQKDEADEWENNMSRFIR